MKFCLHINVDKFILEQIFIDDIKKDYQPLIIDFKSVIILRLLGGDEFIYVNFNDEVAKTQDLKKRIDSETREKLM